MGNLPCTENLFQSIRCYHVHSYTCFFTPKLTSPCYAFQHDSKNFKGPDGVLLCYKTELFHEIRRYHPKHQNDGVPGKPVCKITVFLHSVFSN